MRKTIPFHPALIEDIKAGKYKTVSMEGEVKILSFDGPDAMRPIVGYIKGDYHNGAIPIRTWNLYGGLSDNLRGCTRCDIELEPIGETLTPFESALKEILSYAKDKDISDKDVVIYANRLRDLSNQ